MNGPDPVTVEIVEGTLASIEREVETAIGRTARSPMIRDAHDFRAGIHDARLRKLTGRSYSALVHPVVRDFPMDSMRPGVAETIDWSQALTFLGATRLEPEQAAATLGALLKDHEDLELVRARLGQVLGTE